MKYKLVWWAPGRCGEELGAWVNCVPFMSRRRILQNFAESHPTAGGLSPWRWCAACSGRPRCVRCLCCEAVDLHRGRTLKQSKRWFADNNQLSSLTSNRFQTQRMNNIHTLCAALTPLLSNMVLWYQVHGCHGYCIVPTHTGKHCWLANEDGGHNNVPLNATKSTDCRIFTFLLLNMTRCKVKIWKIP